MVKGLSKKISLVMFFAPLKIHYSREEKVYLLKLLGKKVLHASVINVGTAVSQNISFSDHKQYIIHLL